MRISDWSSDVCSSDLIGRLQAAFPVTLIGVRLEPGQRLLAGGRVVADDEVVARVRDVASLVIPYEGIVSTGRVRDAGIAIVGRHDAVGELHDVAVIERERQVADTFTVAGHRRDGKGAV